MEETSKKDYNLLSDNELEEKIDNTYMKASTAEEFEEVITMANVLINRNPENSYALSLRGDSFDFFGRYKEAFDDFDKAVKINPRKGFYYFGRANAKSGMGEYDGVIDDYTKAIYYDNENDYYYYRRGAAYTKLGQLAEAFEDYSIEIELNPNDPANYCNCGATLYDMGKYEKAIDYFTTALNLRNNEDNDSIVLYLRNRANSYRELGLFEKSYADFEKAIQISLQDPFLYYCRAYVENIDGKFDAAYNDIMKTFELNAGQPAKSFYYSVLGNALAGNKKYEEALDYLNKAIAIDSDYWDYYESRANIYTQLGCAKEAEADRAKITEIKTKDKNERLTKEIKKVSETKKINKTAQSIIDALKEKTGKKAARMTFCKQKTKLTGSKLGGVPFIPDGGEYPTDDVTGKKLYLLLQINFEEMPKMKNYPDKGILQIFIADGNAYGCDYGNKQKSWKIRYYEDISQPMAKENIVAMMPQYPKGYGKLPISNPEFEYRIHYDEIDSFISPNDVRFDEQYKECCSDCLPDRYKRKDFDELPESILEPLEERLCDDGSRVGGYPDFVQDGMERDIPDNYELLIQIGSDMDNGGLRATKWSDFGIAHFFIDPEDLKNRDFSKVIYWWE